MRLIDADELKFIRIQIFHGMNPDGTPCVGGWNAALLSCAIDDAPTVDAVPVVHGRWGNYDPYLDGYRCSRCKLSHRCCTPY